ncbi:type II toxin-antitoxin system VapC family toxin [Leifsonia sp. Root112D2]|uniref:type II toxin-antitoxin system VapC family toxin n=1 Tax=Leifsonia sp. Root112D2 TaxID=1736426 RepID=UPI0006FB8DF4|nr:type II toxin-antitoxin system VapC family toxin [Leifsonia sp. Root112D2]KQV07523.1 plasmid stabilization protein [Leifsonia sp. Root112D2]
MIVLDTNVISEVVRSVPNDRVVAWLEALTSEVAITAVTLAELLAGVGRLPDGRRKAELSARIAAAIEPFRGTRSILAFDDTAAAYYADVLLAREAAGRPISTADAQIAAICLAHDATCATRDVRDFSHTEVDLLDPWSD